MSRHTVVIEVPFNGKPSDITGMQTNIWKLAPSTENANCDIRIKSKATDGIFKSRARSAEWTENEKKSNLALMRRLYRCDNRNTIKPEPKQLQDYAGKDRNTMNMVHRNRNLKRKAEDTLLEVMAEADHPRGKIQHFRTYPAELPVTEDSVSIESLVSDADPVGKLRHEFEPDSAASDPSADGAGSESDAEASEVYAFGSGWLSETAAPWESESDVESDPQAHIIKMKFPWQKYGRPPPAGSVARSLYDAAVGGSAEAQYIMYLCRGVSFAYHGRFTNWFNWESYDQKLYIRRHWVKLSADQGLPKACYRMGCILAGQYWKSKDTNPEVKPNIRRYFEVAIAADVLEIDELQRIAEIYEELSDWAGAMALYTKAAECAEEYGVVKVNSAENIKWKWMYRTPGHPAPAYRNPNFQSHHHEVHVRNYLWTSIARLRPKMEGRKPKVGETQHCSLADQARLAIEAYCKHFKIGAEIMHNVIEEKLIQVDPYYVVQR